MGPDPSWDRSHAKKASLKLKVEAQFLQAQPWEEGSGTKPVSPLSNFLSCGEQQRTGAGSTGDPLGSRSSCQAALRRRGGDVHTTCSRVRSFHVLPGALRGGSVALFFNNAIYLYCALTYVQSRFVLCCFIPIFSFWLAKKAATKILAVTKPSQ